jgi:hypothetical protein
MILIWKRASAGGVQYVKPVRALCSKPGIPSLKHELDGKPGSLGVQGWMSDKDWARLVHLINDVDLNK